ncbi:MAG TPA: flagellar type III secretion system pore protein FliP [Candidatus Latescibacteria bacterium]|nr:flagellar type III secretion system pore protein FliP [Candidatus Latescibacterota bacterium]
MVRYPLLSLCAALSLLFQIGSAYAFTELSLKVGESAGPGDVAVTLQIVLLLTILALAPALLIMVTSFTRIVVVFSFLRNAIGTHQMPPNQLLIGLSLFLTVFVMMPVWHRVNDQALQPYFRGEISQKLAVEKGLAPIREFMLRQTREKDLGLFVRMAKMPQPATPDQVPTHILIPAFVISELKTAFQISFVLFIPFLVIDMVVASTLMSMGMLLLPPIMISLPFKILLFVLVDGWYLIVQSLVQSFK